MTGASQELLYVTGPLVMLYVQGSLKGVSSLKKPAKEKLFHKVTSRKLSQSRLRGTVLSLL
jgi:hypothetical protein